MKYPIDCDTARRKTEYLYRAQEELRILHNNFSNWLHKSITEERYNDEIPEFIKSKYPFDSTLSKMNFEKFLKEEFTPRSDRICQEICVQRAFLKSSSVWSIDIGEL